MNIIFDFDGTLLDSKQRLYDLFGLLCEKSLLTYDEYWSLKREGLSHKHILTSMYKYSESEFNSFNIKWMNLIETEEFLKKDILYSGVIQLLEILPKSRKIYLCTARQRKDLVEEQLSKFKIAEYFSDVIVTEQRNTKRELILSRVKDLSDADWLVSDAGVDIKEGRSLGIKTCAVSYGFLNGKVLKNYEPDYIANKIIDLSVLLG